MSVYFRGFGPDKRRSTPESRTPKLAVNRTNKFFREQPKSNFRVGETTLLSRHPGARIRDARYATTWQAGDHHTAGRWVARVNTLPTRWESGQPPKGEPEPRQ